MKDIFIEMAERIASDLLVTPLLSEAWRSMTIEEKEKKIEKWARIMNAVYYGRSNGL
ncbi:hypothetical protein KAR91_34605 [Candidatus Pacearchaeota archaeon]|nr:hypothetical protein [Candidatus Pacearchaeota archaeon]